MTFDPTARELRVFGLLWLLFFAGVAMVASWRPQALIGVAAFLSVAWIVSLVFGPEPRRRQLTGFVMPVVLASAGFAMLAGNSRSLLFGVIGRVAAYGAVAIWFWPGVARWIYVQWMRAAAPAGWTITMIVLGLVYYSVLTPIGLLLQWSGHDPLRRSFERDAKTYWTERTAERNPASYFRQF